MDGSLMNVLISISLTCLDEQWPSLGAKKFASQTAFLAFLLLPIIILLLFP